MAEQSFSSVESSTPPPPGSDVNLQDPAVVIDLFDRAGRTHLEMPRRSGSVVDLPARGRLVFTGDLHDHSVNFHRILKLTELEASRQNRVILHEVIHGSLVEGRDLSVRIMARIAALVLQYPGQVLVMMGNHELAQYRGDSILKGGTSVVEAFDKGLEHLYGEDAEDVRDALQGFFKSLLLAVRCRNGIFCSHSLPPPRTIDSFDPTIIDRVPVDMDFQRDGSAYQMVWGRNHTQKIADELADAWGVQLFLMGHQPASGGYDVEGETMLILNSDHEAAMALPLDLSRSYTRDELIEALVPLDTVNP